MDNLIPVPEPPGYPIIGHITAIDPYKPLLSMLALADTYGEIFRLRLGPTITRLTVSSHELVNEVCDEKRFRKIPDGPLLHIREAVHDGLFTARLEEPNWGIAHRVLMPAFGPINVRNMFPEMHDMATQLALKWARHGSSTPIMVTDDFTRLTLDTIALCSMGYRFNSFYNASMHPFLSAMADFLIESGAKDRRPLPSIFYRKQDQKFLDDIAVLRSTAEMVLNERKAGNGAERKDLLAAMLTGVDPKTGQRMTDESIIDNLITFLIAGHETTSGLLSFAMYQLIKHPDIYRKAQEEVDRVIGKGAIRLEHMAQLPYLTGVLRETLRLDSTIPLFAATALNDEVLAGKYLAHKGETILMILPKSHLDPKVYGDDANEFKPERMMGENFEKLPKNAWKPFGNGQRACIGRPFAWQEAMLMMAVMLQNFNFAFADPNYQMQIKQTLTIKPDNFYMRAFLRDGLTPTTLEHRLAGTQVVNEENGGKGVNGTSPAGAENSSASEAKPLTILYGSNTGTCEAMAHRLAADASQHGFKAVTIDCLDSANGGLPKDQPVIIITASYEGQPPDNAAHFVNWIESIKDKSALSGVQYAVFGCGNHDWTQTFHRIPKLLDTGLEQNGAERLVPIGLADAGGVRDVFVDFETWEDEVLLPTLKQRYNTGSNTSTDAADRHDSSLKVTIISSRSSTLRSDVQEAEVVATRTLTAEGEPVKKHIEIKLPSNHASYKPGDYLAVLPINPKETVLRALRRFDVPWDALVTIEGKGNTVSQLLPTNAALSAFDVLGAYVELAQPATRRNILGLADMTTDDGAKKQLRTLANEMYEDEISTKRTSILDLLERFPSVMLPFGSFLGMLPPMRVRQYSISSSPLWSSKHATITYALLNEPSKSEPTRHHLGVASSYLDRLQPGDRLHVAVRPSHVAFHLPADETKPVICVAAGSGLAPFRAFIQDRAAMIEAGRKAAPITLYFGCREPSKDDIYAAELKAWEKTGACIIHRAYSRTPELSGGCRYVQDALWKDRESVLELWDRDAQLFVCGSRRVGEGVREVAIKLLVESARRHDRDVSEEEASKLWDSLRNVRYASDVFD